MHLTQEHICRWLAGERREEEQRHLRECPACQAELDRFQNTLVAFRNSLEQSPVPPVSWRRIRPALPRWIFATAALSLAVAAPVFWTTRRAAEQAKADQLLLERVNAGLSRSVPASMEPLMQLISRENSE
jgi:anti-sigma factor RsiW